MAKPDRLPRPLVWLWHAVPLMLFGLVWQGVSASGLVDPAFLPPPRAIGLALLDLLGGSQIRDNLLVTLYRSIAGLALGSVAGMLIGLLMARSARFNAYIAPIVGGTYSLPKSALIPLLILWFGVGSVTAIIAVFLACLLPMIVQTFQGVVATPKVLVWSAEAMGYTPRQLLTRVYLRHALPDIMTGLRVALGFSFVLALSSEMIAANSGIGKLIFMYGENGAYDYMFAAIACVVVVAFLADRALLWVTQACLHWHESAVGAGA